MYDDVGQIQQETADPVDLRPPWYAMTQDQRSSSWPAHPKKLAQQPPRWRRFVAEFGGDGVNDQHIGRPASTSQP